MYLHRYRFLRKDTYGDQMTFKHRSSAFQTCSKTRAYFLVVLKWTILNVSNSELWESWPNAVRWSHVDWSSHHGAQWWEVAWNVYTALRRDETGPGLSKSPGKTDISDWKGLKQLAETMSKEKKKVIRKTHMGVHREGFPTSISQGHQLAIPWKLAVSSVQRINCES